ncbi:MAG: HEAT repeat domain-containing protein [Planctomycetales bacterium]|nr:HEAT repeat domain-containing protein [Planctomycetales bacterium]
MTIRWPHSWYRGCWAAAVLFVCSTIQAATFRAGSAVVDVTPQTLPVIRNGGFLEATDDRIEDPLAARCLVLDDGSQRIAIVVVDSCMIPRDICDLAKSLAAERTSILPENMLISATHTHSAPSVMDYCLGARKDPVYSVFLPNRIADAMVAAEKNLQPAQAGWGEIDAHEFTKNRRWITRSDQLQVDPFGERTVHAMMHPGHLNPAYTGPSGPIDPWLTMLKVETLDGQPLAMLSNLSMHYFGGHPGVSADYFGRFARSIPPLVNANNQSPFVAILSQGTSGDLWWGDYSKPADQKPFDNMEQFVDQLARRATELWNQIECQTSVTLAMEQKELTLKRRTPSPERLAWAERKLQLMGDRRPQDQPEVYALQAKYMHENPTESILVQAIRIGDGAITAMPNEVYAITGLKLKYQNPLPHTMNISLANGASGYIPPPEQHALGGYTTWPARTAGLEVEAEPKIVEAVLQSLETVSEKPRQTYREPATSFSQFVLDSQPVGYWRLADLTGPNATNVSENSPASLQYQGRVAFHLPGVTDKNQSPATLSRCVHLAGGRLAVSDFQTGESYTVCFAFQVMTPHDFRGVTGTLFERDDVRLVVTGTDATSLGLLQLGDSLGANSIEPHAWHQLVMVRNGDFLQVWLDDADRPELTVRLERNDTPSSQCIIGGDVANSANLEGKIDELAVYDRAFSDLEVRRHLAAAFGKPLPETSRNELDSLPQDPESSMQQIVVPEGFRIELVAAEPLVQDPVAIDWGPDGKLWVAEMADYPLGMDGQGKPGGRIRWLADSDQDGQLDQSVVFLENVSFPNGVMAWKHGVLITAAPEILFAADTDGDGKADQVQSLYSGFLEANQQLRVNGLRWGLDGWVYCASGGHYAGFGKDVSIFSNRLQQAIPLGSRDFRIRPDTGELDPQAGPSQYGRIRDDFGNWFGVQNSLPLWHFVLPENYLRSNPFVRLTDLRHQVRTPQMPKVFSAKPPQKRFHGFDHPGHYTSACGISVYRDDVLFPVDNSLTHAFTCEPFHNLVQHHLVHESGTSFDGERAPDGDTDFFASADRWCRPVMSRTGPDGALWIVDMYRYMIEHPQWLPSEGQEELRPAYREGERFGRIYRMIRDSVPAKNPVATIDMHSTDGMLGSLQSSNGIVRDLAHRFLLEHHDVKRTIPKLRQLVAGSSSAAVRTQALWLLENLAAVDQTTLMHSLNDAHPDVRRNAVQIAESKFDAFRNVLTKVCSLANDENRRVQLQVACSLGATSDPDAGAALWKLAQIPNQDAFFQAAILSSIEPQQATFLSQLSQQPSVALDRQLILALLQLASNDSAMPSRLIAGSLVSENGKWHLTQMEILAAWLESLDEQSTTWQAVCQQDEHFAPLEQAIKLSLDQANRMALSPATEPRQRIAAIRLFDRNATHAADRFVDLIRSIDASENAELAGAVADRIRRQPQSEFDQVVLSQWASLPTTHYGFVIELLIEQSRWTHSLLTALENGTVSWRTVALSQRQRLEKAADAKVAARATKFFASVSEINPQRQAVIDDYRIAKSMIGDVAAGQQLFQQHCAVCHLPQDNLPPVGPDLKSVTDRTATALLESILDPSRTIDPKYMGVVVQLNSGESITGLVTSESTQLVSLAKQDGSRRTIERSRIEMIDRSEISIMPDGFETQLSPSQLADLLAFLAENGRN